MIHWISLLLTGIFSVVAGVMALTNPFSASFAAEMVAGWSFVVLGALQVAEGLKTDERTGRFWSVVLGVIAAAVGVSLLSTPLQGLVTLSILIGLLLLISALAKTLAGLKVERKDLKMAILLSAVVSALLGVIILAHIQGAAILTLGVMLGVELIANGICAMALAASRRWENAVYA